VESAEPPGVSEPLVLRRFEPGRGCDGMSVLSKWVEDADESLAESGFVGLFRAETTAVSQGPGYPRQEQRACNPAR
jgi:hypothetical protein